MTASTSSLVAATYAAGLALVLWPILRVTAWVQGVTQGLLAWPLLLLGVLVAVYQAALARRPGVAGAVLIASLALFSTSALRPYFTETYAFGSAMSVAALVIAAATSPAWERARVEAILAEADVADGVKRALAASMAARGSPALALACGLALLHAASWKLGTIGATLLLAALPVSVIVYAWGPGTWQEALGTLEAAGTGTVCLVFVPLTLAVTATSHVAFAEVITDSGSKVLVATIARSALCVPLSWALLAASWTPALLAHEALRQSARALSRERTGESELEQDLLDEEDFE